MLPAHRALPAPLPPREARAPVSPATEAAAAGDGEAFAVPSPPVVQQGQIRSPGSLCHALAGGDEPGPRLPAASPRLSAAQRSSLAAALAGPGIAPAPLPAAGWSGSELAPAPGPRPRHPSGDAAARAGRPRSCLGCRSGSSVRRGIRPRRGWGIAVRKMSLPNIKPLFCCFVKESSNPPFPAKNCQNYYDYFCQPSSLKCFACQALDCTLKFGARNVSCELGVADAKSPSNPAGK